MIILFLSVAAILAFVVVYSFKSFTSGKPRGLSIIDEKKEEDISPEISSPEGTKDKDAMMDEEGTLMEGNVEVDLAPGL